MKVALCGLGNMGRSHAQLIAQHGGDIELVAVADVQEELRQQVAESLGVEAYASGEELIDAKVAEVVFICLPTYLHAPLAVRALESGMHVFCEKPMGLDTAACDRMIAAAAASGKLLIIGQVLRFWPEYAFLKEALDSGRYGRLESLSMTRVGGVSVGFEGWYLDEVRGGMQIFDRHIHDTDLTLWLLGRPKAVRAFGVEKCASTQGGIVHSFTEYQYDGLAVSAEGSADMPKGFPFTMGYRAVFERACIEYSNRFSPTLAVYDGGEPVHPELPNPVGELKSGLNIRAGSGYFLEQAYFFDCIRSGRKPAIVTPESARETIEVVRAEIASVRAGRAIEL